MKVRHAYGDKMADTNKNVFISHYGKDDEHIGKLKGLMKDKGYILKNSSMDSTKPNQANNENYIKQLLRDRMKWAGTVMVLIGKDTHKRDWVNWEIELANRLGKKIVGVFINGASDSDIPDAFEKYGDSLVGWTSGKIIEALEGSCTDFQNTEGGLRISPHGASRGDC